MNPASIQVSQVALGVTRIVPCLVAGAPDHRETDIVALTETGTMTIGVFVECLVMQRVIRCALCNATMSADGTRFHRHIAAHAHG